MKKTERVKNRNSPYYGKRYDELPPLPPRPAAVVRNPESAYYGMELKKTEQLHRKLYPHKPPALKSFKEEPYPQSPKEAKKLSDPFYVMKGNFREMVNWCVVKRLLRPAALGDRRASEGWVLIEGAGKFYTALSGEGWKRELVGKLGDLSREILRLEKDYAKDKLRLKRALLRAFQLGMDSFYLAVLPHDLDIAKGIPLPVWQRKGGEATRKKFARKRAERTALYQPDIDRRVGEGQSFEQALIFTANQHHIRPETLRKYVVNPRRRKRSKKV
jgi:hypothetical protein